MIYGIDLGTSNCKIADVHQFGGNTYVRCLEDDSGSISFPTVVHYNEQGHVVVGAVAKSKLPEYPEETVELVKVRMGKINYIEVKANDCTIEKSPQEISAVILKHANKLHNDDIKDAILTVPAYFNDSQKQATLAAGEIANINIVEMIEEPSAAIMYHLFDAQLKDNIKEQLLEPKNYLVFDFGGGTLDLSLIKIELDQEGLIKPTVIIKGGNPELGGNNIDFIFTQMIIEELVYKYNDQFILSVQKEYDYYFENHRFTNGLEADIKEFIMHLKSILEDAKIRLSTEEVVEISTLRLEYDNISIHRSVFDNLLDERIRENIIHAINDIKERNRELSNEQHVDELIMVGGSSQIPYVQRLLAEQLPELEGNIVISDDYDTAIAKGAAILGAIKSGQQVSPFGLNRCHSSVSHNIYIEHNDIRKLLISYGEKYPFESPQTAQFEIRHALDTHIKVIIKEELRKNNPVNNETEIDYRTIKEFKFFHHFFYPKEEVVLNVNINDHGLLTFYAEHKPTGERVDFTSEKLFQLNDEEFNKVKNDVDSLVVQSR